MPVPNIQRFGNFRELVRSNLPRRTIPSFPNITRDGAHFPLEEAPPPPPRERREESRDDRRTQEYCKREIARLTRQIQDISDWAGLGDHGVIEPSSFERQISYGREGGSLYKGGFVSGPGVAVADDAVATTIATEVIDTSRLSGCRLHKMGVNVWASSATGGQLLVEPFNVTMSLTINGTAVPECQDIPLDMAYDNGDSQRQIDLNGLPIGADVNLRVVYTVQANLGGITGQTSSIKSWFQSGN